MDQDQEEDGLPKTLQIPGEDPRGKMQRSNTKPFRKTTIETAKMKMQSKSPPFLLLLLKSQSNSTETRLKRTLSQITSLLRHKKTDCRKPDRRRRSSGGQRVVDQATGHTLATKIANGPNQLSLKLKTGKQWPSLGNPSPWQQSLTLFLPILALKKCQFLQLVREVPSKVHVQEQVVDQGQPDLLQHVQLLRD